MAQRLAETPAATEATKRPEVVVIYQDHKLFIQNNADTSVMFRATSYDGEPIAVAPRIIPKGAYYYVHTDVMEARLAAELSHPGFFQKEWDLYLTPQGSKEEFVSRWLLVFTVDEHGWRLDTQNIAVDLSNH